MSDTVHSPDAGPICGICRKQATHQDIDGCWWSPCGHDITQLRFCHCAKCEPATPISEARP